MSELADRLVNAALHADATMQGVRGIVAATLFELSCVHWVAPDAAAAMNELADEIQPEVRSDG